VKPADKAVEGVKVTPIIPLPYDPKDPATSPRSWGETDLEGLESAGDTKYDENKDVAPPIYGGAVAEKDKGGRLVVIAAPFPMDQWIDPLRQPDPGLLKQRILASRFPGNAELFTNSVFWLTKMEPLIAISPSAMEVARIEPIGEGTLRFWRVGGLLVGLPGLVVLAGAMVYFARRD